ncbi:MAG TPA: GNAT family N-acetyltransferase, partial [Clostridia bacterium]|nr:GNAT family N-acetyltransferase [Clostridia bacterium]
TAYTVIKLIYNLGSGFVLDRTVDKDIVITCSAGLDRETHTAVSALQDVCERYDKIALKLELDYKLNAYELRTVAREKGYTDELVAYEDGRAVGYIGICSFGGPGMPLEVTGMVHPAYRQRGIFTRLYALALCEFKRRNCADVLLLCDRTSAAGHAFLEKIGSAYKFCEVEMHLKKGAPAPDTCGLHGILLQKAKNADAATIQCIDAAAWNKPESPSDADAEPYLPEEEEKRGLTTYLGKKDGVTVGKINLQKSESGVWGIYGFSVLPEFRGRGYGRAMLKLSLEKMKASGAKEIMLQVVPENERALNLYKSCGFDETSVMDYYELSVKREESL